MSLSIPEPDASSASDETQTVCSDTDGLRDSELLEYVTAFADELLDSLPADFDKNEFERVSPVSDEILRTFALKVNYDGSTEEHRSLTYLVYHYRRWVRPVCILSP